MICSSTREIAEFVCQNRYDDLPAEVIDYSRILALSHIGMTVAGATMDFGRKVIGYVSAKGGQPEAGVFGAGFRTSAENAGLANGNSAHATELEDNSYPEGMYSCGYWPAVFALGEAQRSSGRDLILAYATGYEVSAKLGLAYIRSFEKGRASYAALPAIGNAVAGAMLLGLGVEETANAISFAASQATGLRRQVGSGAHVVEAGFAVRNGICAAELAARGYTGSHTILEGKDGFGDMWADSPIFDLDLGNDYRVMRIAIKKYSCCYGIQRNIDVLLRLKAQHALIWDDIVEIEHGINTTSADRFLNRQQPTTEEDARFSFEHCSVACFFDGDVFLHSLKKETVNDSIWQEARKKVKVTIHPEYAAGSYDNYDSHLTIVLKDGRTLTALCHSATGSPDNGRFGTAEVMEKYNKCMDFARLLSPARTTQIAEMTLALDELEDISSLTTLLTFPDRATPSVLPQVLQERPPASKSVG